MRRALVWIAILLAALLLVATPQPAYANGQCDDGGCEVVTDPGNCYGGCTIGGGSGGGEVRIPGNEGGETNPGNGSGGGSASSCGVTFTEVRYTAYDVDGNAYCATVIIEVDSCSGSVKTFYIQTLTPGNCEDTSSSYQSRPICDRIDFANGRLLCHSTCFNIKLNVSVPFPGNCIDLRPYPASLVNWPSAARYSCASSATGSDFRPYVNFGGGTSVDAPRPGDWRNVRLSLTLYPLGVAYLWLPHVPTLTLPLVNDTAPPVLFKFPYSSHPAAGGGPLAAAIPGFDEIPGDMPVFVGQAAAAYGLRWSLTYEEYQEVWKRVCVPGPKDYDRYHRPIYECKTSNRRYNDGHYENHLVYSGWTPKSLGGPLPPTSVTAPAALKADLNGDGTPDAFWNRNFIIRRMNDVNRIDDPVWRRQWAFGGTIYWGVREGQAQIGWPGSP